MSDWFDDTLEEMEQAAAEQAEEAEAYEWVAEAKAGDSLKGVFLKAVPVHTKYGVAYSVFVRALESDGEHYEEGETVKVFCSRTTLIGELKDALPRPGKLVIFHFAGKKETRQGNREYYLYQVRAEEQGLDYWRDIAKAAAKLEAQAKEETQERVQRQQESTAALPDPF